MDERGLGKQLQSARQAARLTQQQLCQKANLSFSTMTKIERGAIKAPSIFTIQAIASALGVGLDELLGNITPVKSYKKTKSGASFTYFDVNGCLVRFYQRAFNDLARDTGVSADVVETVFWQYNDDACRGTMSKADFNAKLAERLGVESVDWQKYYLSAVEPVQDMHDLVKSAAENYKIGLLTNIMPGLLVAMRRGGQLPDLDFDAIVDSSEVGTIKPEAKMYEIAEEKAGVPAEEILLIDDSRSNLMPAAERGWKVLGYDDARPAESIEMARATLQPAED
jgi:putative hydrolase of the HAD superfamily